MSRERKFLFGRKNGDKPLWTMSREHSFFYAQFFLFGRKCWLVPMSREHTPCLVLCKKILLVVTMSRERLFVCVKKLCTKVWAMSRERKMFCFLVCQTQKCSKNLVGCGGGAGLVGWLVVVKKYGQCRVNAKCARFVY